MARTSYDDWNFMGEVHREEIRARNARTAKTRQINNQRNSFIFPGIALVAATVVVFKVIRSIETA